MYIYKYFSNNFKFNSKKLCMSFNKYNFIPFSPLHVYTFAN